MSVASCNIHWRIGGEGDPIVRPPRPKIFSISCSVSKILQNRMLAPTGGLAPPPTGDPGFAPDISSESTEHFEVNYSNRGPTVEIGVWCALNTLHLSLWVLPVLYQQDFPVSIKFFCRHDNF